MENQIQKVVVLDDYQCYAAKLSTLEGSGLQVVSHNEHLTGDDLVRALEDANFVIAMRERTPLSAAFLSQFPNLKLVVTTGMRNDSITVPENVLLCGTRILPNPVVELTWALILGCARNLTAEQESLRRGDWQQQIGMALAGKRLGLVGLGKSGTAVAKVAQAFSMEVVAWSQNLDSDYAASVGVTAVDRDILFSTSDVVSIHLRLSDRTQGLVTAPDFALMKPESIFVNTSRAAIVNTSDLAQALNSNQIAAAGVDVFDEEPIEANNPLLDAKNALLTPHMGYVVDENYRLFFEDAFGDIIEYLAGTPVRIIGN